MPTKASEADNSKKSQMTFGNRLIDKIEVYPILRSLMSIW